jgi:phage-related protein
MKIRDINISLEHFIKSLETTTIARVVKTINLLQKFNFKLGMPHSKKVNKDLFELRVRGKQEVRIFYSFDQSRIILIHGFVKKSQKLPKKEIQIAIKKLKHLTNT